MYKYTVEGLAEAERKESIQANAASSPDTQLKPDTRSQGQYEYELKGVVVHSGTAFAGHYYSYIKVCLSAMQPLRLLTVQTSLLNRTYSWLQSSCCVCSFCSMRLSTSRHAIPVDTQLMTSHLCCSHGQARAGDGCPASSGRWFCFDDVNVEAYDIGNLEMDCFGGKYTLNSQHFKVPQQVSCSLWICSW